MFVKIVMQKICLKNGYAKNMFVKIVMQKICLLNLLCKKYVC